MDKTAFNDERDSLLPKNRSPTSYSTAVEPDEEESVLTYHDLVYAVKMKKNGPCRPAEDKVILHGVSGIMKPGMNAILGPTGSGKTTLLDILAGRKSSGSLTGQVLVNGRPLPADFKCMSGYVIQDDIVMGTLSVLENLLFSAALRLPQSVSKREKRSRVEMVINELGLQDVANSKIGTELIRGISGGERKRTNIGMELIISPSVLFLDEPTTGLDAYTAVSVMQLLQQLSRRGTTVIFSIHQPRYAIFKLFDSLTLLGNGQTIFHGSPGRGLKFLEEGGHHCDERENPADFFLDVIQQSTDAENQSLSLKYHSSPVFDEVKTDANAVLNSPRSAGNGVSERRSVGYPTSFFYQFFEVSKRTLLNLVRNPVLSFMQWMFAIIFGLLIGGIYYQVTDSDPVYGIQNRVGAFFFLVMNMIFANMSAVQLFIAQRPIFKHESLSGYYRVSSYFFAEIICDVIPLRMIPTLILSCVSYWMIGLVPAVGNFFFFTLNLILTTLVACALAFLMSSLVSTQAVATLFLALVFVLSMLFGGLLVNLESLPSVFYWIKYLSIFRYSLEALSVNELKGMEFCPQSERINGTCPGYVPANSTGTLYLENQGFTGNVWFTQVALGAFLVGILFLAYLRLRMMKKTR
eukprot:m.1844 g.1844  ORF g.1844 m.1844 type:complete len:634 (+) comp7956_c0_seq1:221-2122(+)